MKDNKIRNIFLIILIIFILFITTFLIYFSFLSKNSAGDSDYKAVYNIEEGDSTWSIAKDLENDGFVNRAWSFFFYVKVKNLTVKSGSYLLSENMPLSEIAIKISDGNTVIRKITTIEGWRLEQIAAYLDAEGYVDYYTFLTKARTYEGTLYPDTYYISTESDEDSIIKLMTDNYQNRVGSLDVSKADLIIASIVEREAENDEQRATIAGVYRNRIENNMKLESCPTVNYAYDSEQAAKLETEETKNYNYWQNISFSLYKTVISNYNTYLNRGLPPNPIANPGIMSIDASVNYAKHDYLYFLHDSEGNIHLAESATGHEQNKAKYLN